MAREIYTHLHQTGYFQLGEIDDGKLEKFITRGESNGFVIVSVTNTEHGLFVVMR